MYISCNSVDMYINLIQHVFVLNNNFDNDDNFDLKVNKLKFVK